MHGSPRTQFRINHLLSKLQLLMTHLHFLRPVAAELSQVVRRTFKVDDARGVAMQEHRLLLRMRDFAPGLDDVLLGVGDVMQFHLHRIVVVLQRNDGLLRIPVDGLLLGGNVLQEGTHIPVGVRNLQCRLEIILHPGGHVGFPATGSRTTVGTCPRVRRELRKIFRM